MLNPATRVTLCTMLALGACQAAPGDQNVDQPANQGVSVASNEGATGNSAAPSNATDRVADAAADERGDAATETFAPWQSTAILTANGLSAAQAVRGKRKAIEFGAARAAAEAALVSGADVAAVDRGTMEECGAGPIDFTRYDGGLVLLYQDGKFLGWSLGQSDGPRWATSDGALGIGTARSSLGGARIFGSTLGEEFTTKGISGLIDKGRVTDLWAGLNCNFR